MNDRIKELQREIEAEKHKISNCNHKWGEPYENKYTTREPYGTKMVRMGVDIWYEPTGYHDVNHTRWAIKCKSCGTIKYTDKTKPIIKGFEPDFD